MCGIFGIFASEVNVAKLTYFGLLSLQHRGQEAAGIAVSNLKKINLIRGIGLINQVFNKEKLKKLKGKIAIGHTRYSTQGASDIKNAQPILLSSLLGDFALVHNGNLSNFQKLKNELLRNGIAFDSETDTELIARLIAYYKGKNWQEKIINGLSQIKGAYSLVLLTEKNLYLLRDPWGIRPLILGRINKEGWIGASETSAIENIGGEVVREVEPGEFIEIRSDGSLKTFYKKPAKKTGFCIFEYVYFSRPDNVINGKLVQEVRVKTGKLLARQKPVKADMIISVPDSGTSAALGYSLESKTQYSEGLIKSRYIGRTFIQPEQQIRDLGVRLKFSPLKKILKNKKIVLVDDSIVRGTTLSKIVKLIKEAGAKEIHVRIASPPFKNICYLGVDVSRYKELIAAKKTVEEIKKDIGADSLEYLTLNNLKKAVGKTKIGFCTGCFNGDYPVKLESFSFRKRLAILISDIGKGTNLQAIIDGVNQRKINA
ncbi:MAG: amidophosphoribosyltransferase, partial [Microgenomates group bacterium]